MDAPARDTGSTHTLKASTPARTTEFEAICMSAASTCGINAAKTDAFFLGQSILVNERFDRVVSERGTDLQVTRLHQEDLDKAFVVTSASKCLELPGRTCRSVAEPIYERSSSVLADIERLARIAVFDYLIGNRDNHLRACRRSMGDDGTLRLAPAYDMLCTTHLRALLAHDGKAHRAREALSTT